VGRGFRIFYVATAVAVLASVFVGFAPTFYLRAAARGPLPALVVAHGTVFSAWVLLFLAQTTLVASGRLDLHRRLGLLGAALAVAVFSLGLATALAATRRAYGAGSPGALPFLALPFGDMALFGGFVSAGLLLRHRPETHKRLLMLATVALLSAAFARFPPRLTYGGPFAFGGIDAFVVALLAYDLATRRRPHPVSLWGGLTLVTVERLRILVSHSAAWLALAKLFMP
jgi:hypothetical protein